MPVSAKQLNFSIFLPILISFIIKIKMIYFLYWINLLIISDFIFSFGQKYYSKFGSRRDFSLESISSELRKFYIF